MRPLFTDVLTEQLPTGSGTYTSGFVPGGFRWIVRDINAVCNIGGAHALLGFTMTSGAGTLLNHVGAGHALGDTLYRWTGRQALDEGDEIITITNDDGWQWRITGYKLTI